MISSKMETLIILNLMSEIISSKYNMMQTSERTEVEAIKKFIGCK
jgi:hypothetical protein